MTKLELKKLLREEVRKVLMNEVDNKASMFDLLQSVSRGDTSYVKGVKVDKKQADTLIKIYDLLDVSGQRKFDAMPADKLVRVFNDLIFEGSKLRKRTINEASFLDAMEKVNSGYDAKKSMQDLTADSLEDAGSSNDSEHKRYVKSMQDWIKKMDSNGPTVKVGDLVKVYMRNDNKYGIGQIVKPTIMRGSYANSEQIAPNNIPAWQIDCYTERNIGTSKKPIEYKGKTYYFEGTVQYAQFDEGDKNTFSKL
jgi:YHS domain-containing protein